MAANNDHVNQPQESIPRSKSDSELTSKFHHAVTKTTTHILNNVQKHLAHFCKSYTKEDQEVERVAEQFKRRAEQEMEARLSSLFTELGCDGKIAELEELMRGQGRFVHTQAWRPTGVPEDDIASREMGLLLEYEGSLKELSHTEWLKTVASRERVHRLFNTLKEEVKAAEGCGRNLDVNLLQLDQLCGS